MDLRDRSGAVTPAEGCMFFAMLLFAALLVTLLVLAVFRFRERPSSDEMAPPAAGRQLPARGPNGRALGAGDWSWPAGSVHG